MGLQDRIRVLGQPVKRAIRRMLGSLTSVVTNENVVALTFDDGPHPEYTPRVIEILARHQARATFFMVGQAAQRYPDLVRKIGEAGHAIGGHSWDHSSFRRLTGRQRRRQMRACEQALAPYGQPLFRPPYGEQSVAARIDAFWMGYEVVGWTANSGDWYETDASLMASHLVRCVHPGSIILLHDALFDDGKPSFGPKLDREAHADRESMLRALETMLACLCATFRFVTVPELLRHGLPYRPFWFKKSPH